MNFPFRIRHEVNPGNRRFCGGNQRCEEKPEKHHGKDLPKLTSRVNLVGFNDSHGFPLPLFKAPEKNTAGVPKLREFYGDTVKYITAPGEQVVRDWDGQLPPYIYIDAYDFAHPEHSDERNRRYEELQGSSINEEDCWRMHLECAEAFVEKFFDNFEELNPNLMTCDPLAFPGLRIE